MRLQKFTAASAAEAIAAIRNVLGPNAVVLNVRPLPSEGLSKLWRKAGIEVLACAHDPSPEPPPADSLSEIRQELARLREQLHRPTPSQTIDEPPTLSDGSSSSVAVDTRWNIARILQAHNVQPLPLKQIVDRLHTSYGELPPPTLVEELQCLRESLAHTRFATIPPSQAIPGVHVFVGPAGSGKSTALCQWATQTSLITGQPASIWKLDGQRANTCELTDVYGDILGIPVLRQPVKESPPDSDRVIFVDIPGIDWRDANSMNSLQDQLASLEPTEIHLVLNLAYDANLLLAQTRAFRPMAYNDIIVTHLDEEVRWAKILNLAFGTNCSVRFLGTGQNIPGDFLPASTDRVLSRVIHSH